MTRSKVKPEYRTSLSAARIIGGANALTYGIGLVRTKVAALLLGPEGIGLLGIFQVALQLMGTVAGLGFGTSAVRVVSERKVADDLPATSRFVNVVRIASARLALAGLVLTLVLSMPLSRVVFGSSSHFIDFLILAVGVAAHVMLFSHQAILQGLGELGSIARSNVFGTLAALPVALALYGYLGASGIPIALAVNFVAMAAFSVHAVPSWVGRQQLSTRRLWHEARPLLGFGIATMWGTALGSVTLLTVRSVIVRSLDLDSAGQYTSAWIISGMLAQFVLAGLGTEFYPRLSSVAGENAKTNLMVNRQVEIGLLLAIPGLMLSVTGGEIGMSLLFSSEFVEGARLLPWFVAGIAVQVASWPLGFIQRAAGRTGWLVATQTEGQLVLLLASVALFQIRQDLLGFAIAIPLAYALHSCVLLFSARRISKFGYNRRTVLVQLVSAGWLSASIVSAGLLSGLSQIVAGCFLSCAAGLFSAVVIRGRRGSAPMGKGSRLAL